MQTARTLDDAQSLNKEPMAGMTQSHHVALITHQEDSVLDSYNNSKNKSPTNEDAATETNLTIQPDRSEKTTKKELLYCVVSFPI